MRKSLTMLTAALGFAAATAMVPASAAPLSNSAALKSATETQATEVQFRGRWRSHRNPYFKRDCIGDYDSSGVRC
jgi:ABC-type glycerol-3-phosphate transport system substrate-binding protein